MQRSRRHTTTSSLPCALAALCSRTEVAIERAAKALKVEGVKRYTDMHALFAGFVQCCQVAGCASMVSLVHADPDVDVVDILLPTPFMSAAIRAALESGGSFT